MREVPNVILVEKQNRGKRRRLLQLRPRDRTQPRNAPLAELAYRREGVAVRNPDGFTSSAA